MMPSSNSCARCKSNNRPGRRYCAVCGGALPQACPQCGFSNEPGEGFCGGCGAELEAAKPTGGPANRRDEQGVQGERRQVTILFADLSGYTALAAERDPEETHCLLRQFFEAVDSTVMKLGGAVERHIGDNVMGVFGAPVAHGDDPYRAVRAAGEIHRAVAAIGKEAQIELSVHIGIADGTVMAGHTGSTLKVAYGVVGSPVNLAARLQGKAAPAETLVSNSVREATEELIEYESIGSVALKGFDIPIAVWRVVGDRPEPSLERAVPLVGRHAELKLLGSLLHDVLETGHGKTVYVRGEAGIGKTRLMHAIADLAREREFSCYKALVLDFGVGWARDPLRALIADILAVRATSSENDRRAAAGTAVESDLVAPDDAVFLYDLLDVPQPPELRTLYNVMDDSARSRGRRRVAVALVRSASTRTPLLLIVEDLHWADATTLENIAAVAEAMSSCRAVLALTSRIEGDPLHDAWRSRVRGGITAIDLGPLRREEATEFGERLRIANPQLLQRCIDRAEGNPLFLEQLLRNTEESAEADDIPASIQSLVLSRMDRLPIVDKAALQAAAVAGQRFSLDFVRTLIREPAYVPTTLLRHQMIRPEGEELMFSHALVRDGVYSSLTYQRRQRLHRASAEFYQDRDLVLRAEHLKQAHDPGVAAAYAAAALAVASEYRYERALDLAERGCALADGPNRLNLDALRAEYLREVGRARESLDAWEAIRARATGAADRCRALIGVAAANRILSRYQPALSALGEAQPLAEAETLQIERAQIHYYRGSICFAEGNANRSLAEHQAALAAAEKANSPEWRARALSGVGDALYSSFLMTSALAAFQDCVALCDAHGLGRLALPNRIMIGCLTYLQGADDALTIIKDASRFAARAESPQAEMFAIYSLGSVLVQSGRTAEAFEHLDAALARARVLGARRFELNIVGEKAESLLRKGERADALRLAEEAVSISREVGMGYAGPYALAVLAWATDEPSARAAALSEGEMVLQRESVGHNLVWYYRVAAEVYMEDRNWQAAESCAQRLRLATSAEPVTMVEFLTARIGALCSVGRGERGPDLERKLDRLVSGGELRGYHDWLTDLRKARIRLSLTSYPSRIRG
jgi:class 3 adenylate cyclase/tetratricopeptide (TPR) repeat protein